MIAAATDGSFDEFGGGVGYPSRVAVARKDADAIEGGGGNFMMWLFDGAESFAGAFQMVRS